MVQQQVENVWQHMVGVMCPNQTGRKQVKAVLTSFLEDGITHDALLYATRKQIEEVIELRYA